MKRRLKEPFGKAGLTVAVVALVFAMLGGAYAASGGLNGKQKKEVKKIAKQFAGKNGADGAPGANGTNGTNGTGGANGANGTNGNSVLNGTGTPSAGTGNNGDFYINTSNDEIFGPKTAGAWGSGTKLKGTNGANGTNGNSVLNGTGAPSGATGNNGDFYIDTATNKLYGPKSAGAWPGSGTSLVGPQGTVGPQGPQGEPGPLLTTLPAGKTIVGAWTTPFMPEFEAGTLSSPFELTFEKVAFSYTFPVASTLNSENYIQENGVAKFGDVANCPGTAAEPKATSGSLCVYAQEEGGLFGGGALSASAIGLNGAEFNFAIESGGSAHGTWALTGN